MTDREGLSGRQKYQGFKKAFATYNYHLDRENYIAAYVISFSVLEDRINAIFYTRKNKDEEKSKPYVPFAHKVKHICEKKDITISSRDEWLEEAKNRNNNIHQAMWNIDVFKKEDCERVINYAREADKFRSAQRRAYRM